MSSTCTTMSSLATPPPALSVLPTLNHFPGGKKPQGARVLRFRIKPSSLLKSPVVKQAKKLHSRVQQSHETRLAAEQFRVQRLRLLHQSSRVRAAAEEDQCLQQEKELKVLTLAAEKGLEWTALEPQLALALARAVRDTLMAEEATAKLRVHECEHHLATLKDSADEAHARVQDAHHQIASILSFFDSQGIQIHFRASPFNLHKPSEPSYDRHSSSDMDSISDLQSEMASEELTSDER